MNLGHLRARKMAHLERELLERRGDDRERRQQLGVPVALQDLRRGRRGLETETLARRALDLRVGGRVRSDCPRELSDSHPFEGAPESRAVPVELERVAGEIQTECRGLSMY